MKPKTLAQLRSERNLTQRAFAKEISKNQEGINFSISCIAQYEIGIRTPNLKRALIIAKYFERPIEAIIFGPDAFNLKAKSTGTEGS